MNCRLLACIILVVTFKINQGQDLPINAIYYGKDNDSILRNNISNLESFTEYKGFERIRNNKFLHLNIGKNKLENNLILMPLYEALLTYDSDKKRGISNTGIGASIKLNCWKNKIEFYTIIFQGSGEFPSYIDSVINKTNIMPNAGYAHSLGGGRYYFWNNNIGLKFKPNKIFSFTLANDRYFLGNGYRSLLLGTNAYNYPHLKIETKIWKFHYTSIFTNFYDTRLSDGKLSNFKNKYGAIHYLQWQVLKKLQLSFFESIIFQSRKEKGFGYDINYLNPLVFYRPIEYSLGSTDNSLLGANLLWQINNHFSIYGQVILDEFLLSAVRARKGWIDNKQGFQIGAKSNHKFGKCFVNTNAELNYVRPFTYSHKNVNQNYTNYGLPLAHPFGANFYEIVGVLKVKPINYLQINGIASYALIGYDKNGISFGQNVNNSYINRVVNLGAADEGNYVSQGLTTRQILVQLKAHYLINKANSTNITAGFMARRISNVNEINISVFPFIGISTLVFKEGGIF